MEEKCDHWDEILLPNCNFDKRFLKKFSYGFPEAAECTWVPSAFPSSFLDIFNIKYKMTKIALLQARNHSRMRWKNRLAALREVIPLILIYIRASHMSTPVWGIFVSAKREKPLSSPRQGFWPEAARTKAHIQWCTGDRHGYSVKCLSEMRGEGLGCFNWRTRFYSGR